MKSFQSLVVACVLLVGFLAQAESQRYLVLYKAEKLTDSGRLSASERQKLWMSETAKLEATLFAGASAERESLWLVNGTIATLESGVVGKMAAHPAVERILPLGRRAHLTSAPLQSSLATDYSWGVEKLGLPEIQRKFPRIDGTGVRVGIIDTGLDNSNSDLRGKAVAFHDYISDADQPYDDYGHGSFVAGVIAGGDASGMQIGMAPEAKLVVAKAFSQYGGSEDASLLKALQWMADPDDNSRTDDAAAIISNSWNVDSNIGATNPDDEPFCLAVARLRELGIVSVFSAGNDGPGDATVIVPGACPAAITVGATDRRNVIADFSSRGPIRWKNETTAKPDLSAPGVEVYSAWRDSDYTYKSGTSMATPFVAGALALLKQAKPNASPAELSRLLNTTAVDAGPNGFDSTYGFGVVNALRALESAR